ncbi:alpha/beta fold hydrolase [Pseudonocardia ailaonensis]|uniref:Alpha/beta fold hydrolase n=1 Tax=Pseudonocardia ailaonensis TaxID=367279 RepID=A0ABN2N3U0_9PSEU
MVEVAPGVQVWAEEIPGPGEPLLLVMGANASGLTWPDELLARLARHHRVIRYDHRDTGRSTHAFDERPYALRDLADDAVAVLDAFDVDRAHVAGMSLGGTLVQLLLVEHPDRLLSAAVFCSAALEGTEGLPGPDPALLRLWGELTDERTREQELTWRVEHWRLLNGRVAPFDAAAFRALEERIMEHSGRTDSPAAHAAADTDGLDRAAELREVSVPTLVIEAPEDPVNPPPHAAHLAATIAGSRLMTVEGLGHALAPSLLEPLANALLGHTCGDVR